jgi:hypothetical protein
MAADVCEDKQMWRCGSLLGGGQEDFRGSASTDYMCLAGGVV